MPRWKTQNASKRQATASLQATQWLLGVQSRRCPPPWQHQPSEHPASLLRQPPCASSQQEWCTCPCFAGLQQMAAPQRRGLHLTAGLPGWKPAQGMKPASTLATPRIHMVLCSAQCENLCCSPVPGTWARARAHRAFTFRGAPRTAARQASIFSSTKWRTMCEPEAAAAYRAVVATAGACRGIRQSETAPGVLLT